MSHKQTITLTYGDVAENHVGMIKHGTLADRGLTGAQLMAVHKHMEPHSELIALHTVPEHPEAFLLIIRGGVNLLLDGQYDQLLKEQSDLEPDKKALMRGRVVNKKARHNLCFSEQAQEPDYAAGKGTVIAFESVPLTFRLKTVFEKLLGLESLQCEGNYYYDVTLPNVGVGNHGDVERRVVIGVRLGRSMPIRFTWFHKFSPVSEPTTVMLDGGDIYMMSEKATGYDWHRSSILTLRHCAGSMEFLEQEERRIKTKIQKRK